MKIILILSIVLNIFDKLNSTITFVEEDDINDTVLYKPVKDLVPMIFPNILELKADYISPETEV